MIGKSIIGRISLYSNPILRKTRNKSFITKIVYIFRENKNFKIFIVLEKLKRIKKLIKRKRRRSDYIDINDCSYYF